MLVQQFCGVFPGSAVSLSLETALHEAQRNNELCSKKELEDISLKLLCAAQQLQTNSIHHLDIKGDNILLQLMGRELKIILIDYGSAFGTWSSGKRSILQHCANAAQHFPQTAPELFILPRPFATSDFYSVAYMIMKISNVTGNTKLGQEMESYRRVPPIKRKGFNNIYNTVKKNVSSSSWNMPSAVKSNWKHNIVIGAISLYTSWLLGSTCTDKWERVA